MTDRMAITDILVGERRREDLGDIGALAASIRRYGLIHPIVVDANRTLVAGGRRLEAVKSLGWDEIDATHVGLLTDDQRREIELEENIRRKDLSAYERSKNLVALKETVQQIARQETETCADVAQVSKPIRGPNRTAGSLRDVAERTGKPESTFRLAEQHVAAAERYPELKAPGITQAAAITVAKNLDKLPEPERAEKRDALRRFDQPTLAALAEQPPMPVQGKAEPSAAQRWTSAAHKIWALINSVRDAGGVTSLTASWSAGERTAFAAQIHEIRLRLETWETALVEEEHVAEPA